MDMLTAALEKYRKNTFLTVPSLQWIERYLAEGGATALDSLRGDGRAEWVVADLVQAMAQIAPWSEREQRALHMAVVTHVTWRLGKLIDARLAQEAGGEDGFAPFRKAFEEVGEPRSAIAMFLIDECQNLILRDLPTSAGRFLLACSDDDLAAALTPHKMRYASSCLGSVPLVELFGRHGGDRLSLLFDVAIRSGLAVTGDVMSTLLRVSRSRYEGRVLKLIETQDNLLQRFRLAESIFPIDPAFYRAIATKAARAALIDPDPDFFHGSVANWLINSIGADAVPDIASFLSKSLSRGRPAAADALGRLGSAAVPALLAGLHPADGHAETIRKAVGHLIALGNPNQDAAIEDAIQCGLKETKSEDVIATTVLAGRWKPERVAELLWTLLAHKSKPVRESTARALAKQGESAIPRATSLLTHRSADVRSAAVTLLATIATPSALQSLEARVDEEGNDDVRDQILLGLEDAWRRAGRKPTRPEVNQRIARAAPRLTKPVVEWLDEGALPPLHFADGERVDVNTVRYLLYRQSRTKDIRADVEVKPLYGFLDHNSSGAFAEAVFERYLAAGAEASDRWALALAGLLGADPLVPKITKVIRDWVDANRGKLAEYAVQALALMGSDLALAAVDALAIRYRSKMKNVGRAAEEAFAAAAEASGIDVDELADRVVPWLGFMPGEERIVEAGKQRISVTIGNDFKLHFSDLDKNKRVASLPKSASKEVAEEMKDLAAMLRESAKAQVLRLEGLLVRQRRWSTERWQELILRHPLLRPFGVRLAWGHYDAQGVLTATFRVLEDGTLTTPQDEEYRLPQTGTVGIVHPLELDQATIEIWRQHLADHETDPPFPQFERPVIVAANADRGRRVYTGVQGTNLNAMTFKGRAERIGWRRGSVVDGGGVTSYRKTFLAANVDVILYLDGLFMGAGMDDQVSLEIACFVRAGSVKMGGYVYDDPGPDDPRLIPFGEVPPIVYSEAMGDLLTIAGKGTEGGAT
jgi:HEAT repeat protein